MHFVHGSIPKSIFQSDFHKIKHVLFCESDFQKMNFFWKWSVHAGKFLAKIDFRWRHLNETFEFQRGPGTQSVVFASVICTFQGYDPLSELLGDRMAIRIFKRQTSS